MPWRSAKMRRLAAGASSKQTPIRIRPWEEYFSSREASSGSSLAVAGLQAAQRLRRISLPRSAEGSKGWPLAKSEKVISGGSCRGVRDGVQELKRREVRVMRARRCRGIGKERKSTGNPRVGLGEGSTSIFRWRGEVAAGGAGGGKARGLPPR